MGLIWFLVFCLLLATASSLEKYKGDDQRLNHSRLHLTLYHVFGPDSVIASQSSLPFSEILAQDEARVKALNFRLAKNKTSIPETSASSSTSHKSPAGLLLGPKSVSIPLNPGFSIGVGNYYVEVGLGTPPKYYPMVVDTGSSLSWLQCKPCVVYCHTQLGPVFDPSASKTYKHLSCATSECSSLKDATLNDPLCTSSDVCVYTATYGDGSYSRGYLARDSLTLSPAETTPRPVAFVYGCGQDTEGLFGRAAGLIGLARHELSMLAQLSAKYGYAFSYCLPTSRRGRGSLSIGRTSLISLSSAAYKFTPMITDSRDPSLYFLRLTAIAVAGRPLGVAAPQYKVPTIIDSGTVITRLPTPVYEALRQQLLKIMSFKYQTAPPYSILDLCFKASLQEMSAVPKVQMIFQGGAQLALGPHNVLIEVDKGITCLAFASYRGNDAVSIIGNHQQQTFKVAYDISNSRIGFAAGGCL